MPRIRSTDWEAEEAVRKAKEAEKAAKPAKAEAGSSKLDAGSSKLDAAVAQKPVAPAATTQPSAGRSPEEIERLKAEAAVRRAAKTAGEAVPAVEAAAQPHLRPNRRRRLRLHPPAWAASAARRRSPGSRPKRPPPRGEGRR